MRLQNLAAELLIAIVEELIYLQDINALVRTCHRLRSILNHRLYQRALRSPQPWALPEWAIIRGKTKTAVAFLDAAGDIHTAPVLYQNSLCVAAREGRRDLVELLLKRGADVESPGIPGKKLEPIALAAGCGHASTVKLLLDYGANPNPPFPQTWRLLPLRRASYKGYAPVVKLLLEYGANAAPEGNPHGMFYQELLAEAVECKYTSVAELLLEYTPVDLLGSSPRWARPLHLTASCGYYELTKLFLDRGFPVDCQVDGGYTALFGAVYHKRELLVQMLLERGANPNHQTHEGCTPLSEAYRSGEHPDIVKLLVDAGADPSVQPGVVAPLWAQLRSVCDGEPGDFTARSVFESLLRHGADPEALAERYRWHEGKTVLQQAACHGLGDVVEALVNAGASVDRMDDKGRTALFFAVSHGHQASATLLLDKGASLNPRDAKGRTPLHKAVEKGDLGIARLLLERGANPNCVDSRRRTPLSWARSLPRRKMVVDLLVNYGAEMPGYGDRKGHQGQGQAM